jgi:hypothetical protein
MAGLPIALEEALSDLPTKPSLTALKEIVAAARQVTRSLILPPTTHEAMKV